VGNALRHNNDGKLTPDRCVASLIPCHIMRPRQMAADAISIFWACVCRAQFLQRQDEGQYNDIGAQDLLCRVISSIMAAGEAWFLWGVSVKSLYAHVVVDVVLCPTREADFSYLPHSVSQSRCVHFPPCKAVGVVGHLDA
jgi:hypothetical protein